MAFPTLGVLDKDAAPQTINTLPAAGQNADADSLGVTLSTEQDAKLDSILTALADLDTSLGNIDTTLATPATDIPHFAPDATADLSTVTDSLSASGEASLVGATASQTTRVYRGHITNSTDIAVTVSLLDGSGGTVLRHWILPGKGAWDILFDPRPYAITSTNTALYWSIDATADVDITLDYIKSA